MMKSLKIKFVVVIMTIVTIMLAVIFGLVMFFTKQNIERENIKLMQTIAANPSPSAHPADLPNEIYLPFFSVQIAPDGKLSAFGNGYYDLSDENFLHELVQSVFSQDDKTGVVAEYNLRFCYVENTMIVFADISSEMVMMNSLVKNCIFIGIISYIAFFIISLLLAKWAVKPVAKSWIQQKQFIADASHELKTPLTVIMTNAEMLQNDSYSEPNRNQFSENILIMSKRMRGLVESLLELARMDNGTAAPGFQNIDFSKTVSDAILPFEPLFFEKSMEISCEIEDCINIKGDKVRLMRMIDILLDNALKYSMPQTIVKVKLQNRGVHCILSIANDGIPISKADCKNIFKRFYRADKSRSDGHSYGLGLSIAENIVKEHKGRIWVESCNGNNTFFVQFVSV